MSEKEGPSLTTATRSFDETTSKKKLPPLFKRSKSCGNVLELKKRISSEINFPLRKCMGINDSESFAGSKRRREDEQWGMVSGITGSNIIPNTKRARSHLLTMDTKRAAANPSSSLFPLGTSSSTDSPPSSSSTSFLFASEERPNEDAKNTIVYQEDPAPLPTLLVTKQTEIEESSPLASSPSPPPSTTTPTTTTAATMKGGDLAGVAGAAVHNQQSLTRTITTTTTNKTTIYPVDSSLSSSSSSSLVHAPPPATAAAAANVLLSGGGNTQSGGKDDNVVINSAALDHRITSADMEEEEEEEDIYRSSSTKLIPATALANSDDQQQQQQPIRETPSSSSSPLVTTSYDDEEKEEEEEEGEDDETTSIGFGADTPGTFLEKVNSMEIGDKFEFQSLLGKGSYGQVYLAKSKASKTKVAIKRLKVVNNAIYGKRLLRELRILRLCSHENIIKLLDVRPVFREKQSSHLCELLLVFQYADTDLEKLIHSNRNFLDVHIQYFIYQILLALKYLHSSKIIHRDIKPANIFINTNCDLFLGDFGLARGTHEEGEGGGDEKKATTTMMTCRSDEIGRGGGGCDFEVPRDPSSPYSKEGKELSRRREKKKTSSASSSSSIVSSGRATSTTTTSSSSNGVHSRTSKTMHQQQTTRTSKMIKQQQTTPSSFFSSPTSFSFTSPPLASSSTSSSSPSSLSPSSSTAIQKPAIQRSYTTHVVTRWYRAPELMLMEGIYTCAIDVWSVGCILAELLGMLKESNIPAAERRPLFPGRTCFPLSAEDDTAYTQRRDQLNVIFDVIGTPKSDDMSYINSQETREYLQSLPSKNPKSLEKLLPGASTEAIDLLKKLLIFDPRKRITPEEALTHPYLNEVTDLERVNASVNKPILFEFEANEDMTMKQIRRKLKDEVSAWANIRSKERQNNGEEKEIMKNNSE